MATVKKKTKSKSTSWAGIYLLTFAVFVVVGVSLITIDTQFSMLVGLVGIILTLPWSFINAPILDAIGYIPWYDQFVGNPLKYALLAMAGMVPVALLNTWIIHLLEKRRR